MNLIYVLIIMPLLIAAGLFCLRGDRTAKSITAIGATLVILSTLAVIVSYFQEGLFLHVAGKDTLNLVFWGIEALIAVYLVSLGFKQRQYLIIFLAIIQFALMSWAEFNLSQSSIGAPELVFDKLAAIMVFLVGIIGSLICVYAVSYMKHYQVRHPEYVDRRYFFFAILFVFLSAMFLLVLSNNLLWLYFSWELTTLCSFWLIGYTGTEEAKNNSFLALKFNLGGGVAFSAAIAILNNQFGITYLSEALQSDGITLLLPVFLLSIAALTKSAQIPFCSWLVGAMVAPTPSSALLHSSTMVKAGVYLLIRLAPLLSISSAGMVVTTIGCITFMICSIVAITCSDAKKILAYSTLANLGLIVICAGIGTAEAVWAGLLLIIFHAISKSLLFMAVGTTEGQLGSRDVEDMDILLRVSQRLGVYMAIGIAGMFLAPFGMLISKWAAMKAFIDSNNILAVTVIAYGSATTIFYWTKWIGKLLSGAQRNVEKKEVAPLEEGPIAAHAFMIILSCLSFPLISHYVIVPFLSVAYIKPVVIPLELSDIVIMLATMSILLLLPAGIMPFYKKDKRTIVPIYLSGANAGDNMSYYTVGNVQKNFQLTNWYMRNIFNIRMLLRNTCLVSAGILSVTLLIIIGGFKL